MSWIQLSRFRPRKIKSLALEHIYPQASVFQHLNLNHGMNPLLRVHRTFYVMKFSNLPSGLIPSIAFSSSRTPITLSFFLYLSLWSCIYLYGLCSPSRMKAETLLDSLFHHLWFVKSQAHGKMLNFYFAMCENTWDIVDNYSRSSRIFPGCPMSARQTCWALLHTLISYLPSPQPW